MGFVTKKQHKKNATIILISVLSIFKSTSPDYGSHMMSHIQLFLNRIVHYRVDTSKGLIKNTFFRTIVNYVGMVANNIVL